MFAMHEIEGMHSVYVDLALPDRDGIQLHDGLV